MMCQYMYNISNESLWAFQPAHPGVPALDENPCRAITIGTVVAALSGAASTRFGEVMSYLSEIRQYWNEYVITMDPLARASIICRIRSPSGRQWVGGGQACARCAPMAVERSIGFLGYAGG